MTDPELKIDRTLRNIIPALTSEEYTLLESSIIFEGCREPIVVWNGLIIDGHNRYDICKKNNIPFEIDEKNFGTKKEALKWMINNQLGRRNLNDAQKIELALKREELIGTNIGTRSILTQEKQVEIAEETGTSKGNVSKVKKVLDDGDKKTKKLMSEGKISINKAYENTTGKKANKPKPEPEPTPAVGSNDAYTLDTNPGVYADNEEPCSKCHGTGKQKRIVHERADDHWRCGECGRKVFLNIDSLKCCPNCGAKV